MTPNDLWSQLKTIGFLYSMWYSNRPNMRSVQASMLEISCYKVSTIWPLLTSTKSNRVLVLNVVHLLYIPNMRSVQGSLLEISCLQGFLQCFHNLTPVDPKWPLTSTKNNRPIVLNVALLHTKYEIFPSFPCWDIVFTRFSQFDPCWPQMTFDLQPKTIGFLYSMWCTYIPHMRSVQASMLEISCLQCFHNLTPVDP